MEFRRVNNAELLGFNVVGSRGGNVTGCPSLRGGNGGGEISSLGGRIGAFGACFAYVCSKQISYFFGENYTIIISFFINLNAKIFLTLMQYKNISSISTKNPMSNITSSNKISKYQF